MNSKIRIGEQELTKRESEILQYIAEGKSSKIIARALYISKQTVDKHRKNMLKKMGVRNSMELLQAHANHFL